MILPLLKSAPPPPKQPWHLQHILPGRQHCSRLQVQVKLGHVHFQQPVSLSLVWAAQKTVEWRSILPMGHLQQHQIQHWPRLSLAWSFWQLAPTPVHKHSRGLNLQNLRVRQHSQWNLCHGQILLRRGFLKLDRMHVHHVDENWRTRHHPIGRKSAGFLDRDERPNQKSIRAVCLHAEVHIVQQ